MTAAASLPTLVAPSHWQHIEFISDLHLSAALPKTFAAFEHYLRRTPAQAVFILGDLFEVWVGDGARALPFEAECVRELKAASSRLALHFIVGNRDFLLGPAMAQACGMQLLAEPLILQAFGQRALLCHGDALCLADTSYQQFRHMVRGAEWQRAFLARPLEQRLAIAADIRQQSRSRQQFDGMSGVDADQAMTLQWLAQAQARLMIHGHTHRPATHALPGVAERWVLSDWDLDDARHPRAEVLRWTPAGLERRPADPT